MKPIIFDAESVNAILAGRKTQTRRLWDCRNTGKRPYGNVGDRLWVQEAIGAVTDTKVDPRELSRITLEVLSVRVERLQDITESDAVAEGMVKNRMSGCGASRWRKAVDEFADRWDHINSKRASWKSNPRVWVIEFRMKDDKK